MRNIRSMTHDTRPGLKGNSQEASNIFSYINSLFIPFMKDIFVMFRGGLHTYHIITLYIKMYDFSGH